MKHLRFKIYITLTEYGCISFARLWLYLLNKDVYLDSCKLSLELRRMERENIVRCTTMNSFFSSSWEINK